MPAPKGQAVRLLAVMLIAIATVCLIRQPAEVFSAGAMLVAAALLLLLSMLSGKNARLKARLQDALSRGDYLVAEGVPTKIWMRRNGNLRIPMITVDLTQTQGGDDYRLPSQYIQLLSDQNIQGIPVLILQITGASRKLAVFRDEF